MVSRCLPDRVSHVSKHMMISSLGVGTGKTMLPRELASQRGCSIVNISLTDAVRGEIGSGERRVRELFAEAKRSAPSIIFIDEFQAVFTSKEEGVASASDVGATLTATLSGCFDDLSIWNRYSGLESLVTVIASTNEPWAIDRSFLRPQRLERCLFVGPLSAEGRVEFFTTHAVGHDELSGRQISSLVSRTELFTGADLTLLLSRARDLYDAERPSDDDVDDSIPRHYSAALALSKPSVTVEDMEEYSDWQRQHSHLMTTTEEQW